MLIVDDMQFIAGKRKKPKKNSSILFNASTRRINKLSSVAINRRNIPLPLLERLRSRFEWGMSIDIQMPDFETRCAILEAKAAASSTTINRETVEYLTTNIKTNIRERGALNQLLAYSEMRGVPADISTAEGLVGCS